MKNFSIMHEGKEYWISRSVCTVALIVGMNKHGDKFILTTKRGKNTPNYQGYWCLPCGYLDFNETDRECCSREVFEETGLIIPSDFWTRLIVHSNPNNGDQNVSILFKYGLLNIEQYQYKLTNENAEKGEVDEVKWINLNEINNYDWAFNHKELIKVYC
jgi:ADP-ribose pyrophosphatase YjhB (NUDIX family)